MFHPSLCCSSPELWDEPDAFKPERFPVDQPVPNEATHEFKYLPFGGGKRKCIGESRQQGGRGGWAW